MTHFFRCIDSDTSNDNTVSYTEQHKRRFRAFFSVNFTTNQPLNRSHIANKAAERGALPEGPADGTHP